MEIITPYFTLNPAVDTRETGSAYPAAESYDHYDFDAPDSVHKLRPFEFPGFVPDIRFRLAKRARLTDILSQAAISARGLLMNQKGKDLFEKLNMPPHCFYDATIETETDVFNYYWLHLVWNDSIQFIDYARSSFFIKRGLKNMGEININSFEEFNDKNKEMGPVSYIAYQKLGLNNTIPFDLFVLRHSTDIYINSNVKHTIEKEKLTGIDIAPAGKLVLL